MHSNKKNLHHLLFITGTTSSDFVFCNWFLKEERDEMKALGASHFNFFLSRQREKERVALLSTDFAPTTTQQFGFLLHQKGVVLFKANCVASISSSQANVFSEELQTVNLDQPKTVRVRFNLHKQCAFGEQFIVVGNDPNLGSWDPCDGVPLNWSEGHVWTAEVDMPSSRVISYKFILKEVNGTVSWQPGPDRVLETWDTVKMISVSEDWECPNFQNIVEEELVDDSSLIQTLVEEGNEVMEERVDVNNLGLLIAENWNKGVVEELMEEKDGGDERRNDHSDEPSSILMVAENISEEQDLSTSNEGSGLMSVAGKEHEETTLGDHGRVVTNASESSSLKNETSLFVDEGVPVLVPGLATLPLKEVEAEAEASSTEVEVEAEASSTEVEAEAEASSTEVEAEAEASSTEVEPEAEASSTEVQAEVAEVETTSIAKDPEVEAEEAKVEASSIIRSTAVAVSEEIDEVTTTESDETKNSTDLNQRSNKIVEYTATKSDEVEEATDLKQSNNNAVEDTTTESDESEAATKPETHVSAAQHYAETSEMKMVAEDEEPRLNGKKQVLDNDMQWGRRTLHKFLAKLGFTRHS